MKVYIGVTGLSGTGKNTFAEILAELAVARGIGVQRFNLSDEVRRELVRRGRESAANSRKTLIDVANELRATHGPRVLAERTIVQDLERPSSSSQPSLVIVTGVRSPSEVEAFRDAWDSRFLLVAVEATLESRVVRMSERRQYHEDVDPLETVEQADQAIGIPACVRLSDYTISNDSSVDQLRQSAETFLSRFVAPLLGGIRHN